MNERTLEIIVSRVPEKVFGPGFTLAAQQLHLPSGRIDLLLAEGEHVRHVVELKKGRANKKAVEQVRAYAHDLKVARGGLPVSAWVVAHEIPAAVAQLASEQGVRTLAVSLDDCEKIRVEAGLSDADLMGLRRDPGVISGGGAKKGLRNVISNSDAYQVMPGHLAALLRQYEAQEFFEVTTGGMQTVLHYRGVKLGGVNRQHRGGHIYITAHVVVTPNAEKNLVKLGFVKMVKRMVGGYDHIWWEVNWSQHEALRSAVSEASQLVDKALGIL